MKHTLQVRWLRHAFTFLALLMACAVQHSANAQVGSALIAIPWQEGHQFDSATYALGLSADVEGTANDLDMGRIVSLGRFRIDPDDKKTLSFGWLHDQLELDTADAALPERLVNTVATVGQQVYETEDGWVIGVTGGVGFAGDLPYADDEGFYFAGSVSAFKQLDDQTLLTLFIDYDGNRVFLPDVPLPAFQYTHFVSHKTRYSLGIPFSSWHHEPDDNWSFDVLYALPVGVRATVEYKFDDRWTGFATLNSSTVGYHLNDDVDDRRLFFEQSRLEAGGRWKVAEDVEWTVAGGWAFDQEFSRGWDVRDTTTVRELDDAPYLRAGLKVSF